jgi:hypothetical protein
VTRSYCAATVRFAVTFRFVSRTILYEPAGKLYPYSLRGTRHVTFSPGSIPRERPSMTLDGRASSDGVDSVLPELSRIFMGKSSLLVPDTIIACIALVLLVSVKISTGSDPVAYVGEPTLKDSANPECEAKSLGCK